MFNSLIFYNNECFLIFVIYVLKYIISFTVFNVLYIELISEKKLINDVLRKSESLQIYKIDI